MRALTVIVHIWHATTLGWHHVTKIALAFFVLETENILDEHTKIETVWTDAHCKEGNKIFTGLCFLKKVFFGLSVMFLKLWVWLGV